LKKTVTDRPETTEKLDLVMGQLDRISRATRSMLGFFKQRAERSTSIAYGDVIRAATDLFEASFSAKGVRLIVTFRNLYPRSRSASMNCRKFSSTFSRTNGTLSRTTMTCTFRRKRATIRSSSESRITALDWEPDPEPLFEPFYTNKSTGTGLGLTIARRICESYGGKLTAENRKEGGARFEIVLPLSTKREET
jgi:signal transduction histidine kinase